MSTPNEWSIVLPHTETSTTSAIRRGIGQDDLVASLSFPISKDGCQTLYEAIRRGMQLNPKGNCLGYYTLRSNKTEEEEGSHFVYWSYEQVIDKIDAIAAGLKDLNLIDRTDDGLLLVRLHYDLSVLKN